MKFNKAYYISILVENLFQIPIKLNWIIVASDKQSVTYGSLLKVVRRPIVMLRFYWRNTLSTEHLFHSIHLSTELEMGLAALKWQKNE